MPSGTSLSATRKPRVRGVGTTHALAAIALLVLVLVAVRFLSRSGAVRAPSTHHDIPRSAEPVVSGRPAGGPERDSEHERTTYLFADVTQRAGLSFVHECGARGGFYLPEGIGAGGAFIDYNNDGFLDIYLVQSGLLDGDNASYRNRLFRNDGSGSFEDVSSGSGADIPGYGLGCAAADYDNDGDVDLYVTRLGPNVLLSNNGDGTFHDVTAAAGVGDGGFGTGAAFMDYDRDGLLDLYVANYVEWSAAQEPPCYSPSGARDYCSPTESPSAVDRLYHNTGEGRFEDVTAAAGIGRERGNGLGVICTDFDGDGWVDIYVANDQTPAFLWINNRDGTFRERAALGGCAYSGDGMAIAGMGVAAEDLDGDGDYDLVVTNIDRQAHLCLRNDGGSFEDVSFGWGLGGWSVPFTGFGVALFDQDHDGVLDGFIANGAVNRLAEPLRAAHLFAQPNQFLRRDADGRFLDASAEAGLPYRELEMSRGTIVGDYDNDGDIDILVTNNRGPAQLLRNDNDSPNAWAVLDLVPANGARHAINARLVLEADGRAFSREVRPHAGYLGSNDPRVHIGLGQALRIDRLKVLWSDGEEETFRALPVNKHLVLEQGASFHEQANP